MRLKKCTHGPHSPLHLYGDMVQGWVWAQGLTALPAAVGPLLLSESCAGLRVPACDRDKDTTPTAPRCRAQWDSVSLFGTLSQPREVHLTSLPGASAT